MKSRSLQFFLLLLLSFFLEVFLFNIRSFELIGVRETDIRLSLVRVLEADVASRSTTAVFTTAHDQSFPQDLRNLRVQLLPETKTFKGSIHLSQDGLLAGSNRPFEIIPGIEHSAVIALYPSKPVSGMTITFEGDTPAALNVMLNQSIPVRVNGLRVGLIFLLLTLLWLIRPQSPLFRILFDSQQWTQKASLAGLLFLQIAFLTFSMISTYPSFSDAVAKGNLREEDFIFKQPYQLLTESLLQRRTALLEMPPERLAQADNPYDPSQRIDQFPPYLWDMSYYNQRYYVYFGIVPAVVFYIPYTLLFHRYPLNDFAVLFFAIAGSIGLAALYLQLIRRAFRTLPLPLVWIGLASLFNAVFLSWFVRRSFSYELALVSAFCFIVCGLALNLSAGINKKWSMLRIFCGCLCMALAVGCRPTALLASLLNIPILFPLFFTEPLGGGKKTVRWRSIFAAAAPYLFVGAGLMVYNQTRFGSVLEFGRRYQLSIQESAVYVNGNPLAAFLIGLFNYLLGSGIRIISDFPFLQANPPLTFNFWGIKEYYPIFASAAVSPFALFLLFPRIYWQRLRMRGAAFSSFFVLLIFLSILLSGISGYAVGTIQRYALDFSWMVALAALLAAFSIYERMQERGMEKVFFGGMLICFLISLSFQLPLSLGESFFGKSWLHLMNPLFFKKITYFFSFWL